MIIRHSNINYSNFVYQKPLCDKIKNCYTSKIKYKFDGEKRLFSTQTPIITVNNVMKKRNKYVVEIKVKNNKFYNLIYNIDKLNIRAVKNSKNWFDGKVKNTINEMYKYSMKTSNDNNYLMSLNIPIVDGSIQCNIFNKTNSISINKIRTGVDIVSIIKFSRIVFEKDSFYPEWEIKKITICDDNMRCFFEDNSDDVIYSDIETDTKII